MERARRWAHGPARSAVPGLYVEWATAFDPRPSLRQRRIEVLPGAPGALEDSACTLPTPGPSRCQISALLGGRAEAATIRHVRHRYTLRQGDLVANRFGVDLPLGLHIEPRFNVAPGQIMLTVTQRRHGRALVPTLWGFQPSWLSSAIPPLTSAAAESLTERPIWKGVLRRSRCLVVADGFYVGRTRDRPCYVTLQDGGLFGFAGLFAENLDGNLTCALVTTTANALVRSLQERMPAIVRPEDESIWLDPEEWRPARLLPCLKSYPADALRVVPVSTRVNVLGNDAPDLIEPQWDEADELLEG